MSQDRCPNVEAKELGCHAGDWQCIALLLEGDGTTTATSHPRFFGITGSRPAPVLKDGARNNIGPHAFDADGRVAMKVEPWRAPSSTTTTVQPDVVGDHPRFFVARGSHSMYTVAGTTERHHTTTRPRRSAAGSSTPGVRSRPRRHRRAA